MSHTTEVKSVVFTDIQALELTVKELQAAGIRCELLKGVKPRAFYETQEGMGVADYVLKLHDSPYDVGFYNDPVAKGLVARTDLWGGHVQRLLGATARTGELQAQAAMGKLYQTYAVNAAVRQAAKQGYKVVRQTKPDGTIQLLMNV